MYLFLEKTISNRKRLYDHYAGMFPSFEIFCQVMDACTEDFHCLVVNNNAKSNKLEDQVFWYKAEGHPDFKIGAAEFGNIIMPITMMDLILKKKAVTLRHQKRKVP